MVHLIGELAGSKGGDGISQVGVRASE
jgi:hypothetical protein